MIPKIYYECAVEWRDKIPGQLEPPQIIFGLPIPMRLVPKNSERQRSQAL